MQAPHIAIRILWLLGFLLYLGQLLLIVLHIIGFSCSNLLTDALVNDVTTGYGGSSIGEHPIEGLFCLHDGDRRTDEWLVRTHQSQLSFVHFTVLIGRLDTSVPVVLSDFGIAFHDVSYCIDTSELLIWKQSLRTALALHDTMTNRGVLWSQRTGFVVVVDEVRHGRELSSVSRTMYPVVNDIVYIVEHTAPANTWVTASVVCPQVTHKGRILTTYC